MKHPIMSHVQKPLHTTLLSVLILSFLLACLSGCASANKGENFYPMIPEEGHPVPDGEKPDDPDDPDAPGENPFISTFEQPVSTFSADVDTASYGLFRKMVTQGLTLGDLRGAGQGNPFRIEEFLNYFRYEAKGPENGELFGITPTVVPCPWNPAHRLMRITLQAEQQIPTKGNNLVFLIDVSGSMQAEDKLELLKHTFSVLTSGLTGQDRISIVTYSGEEKTVLAGCSGAEGEKILSAIRSLSANGYTNGEAGLRTAYSLAEDYFIEGGNNRIIMASDGDLNVGISSPEALKAFVEKQRDRKIYLSVLGFGTGNYKDRNMETLADCGNGVYYYVDGESEAEKIFGHDLLSTLYTVAGDVKLQLTFDPAAVASYRLIGYENRLLCEEDFDDDKKDAGEVGAGHQVTVCYELIPADTDTHPDKWMSLAVRYKRIGETASEKNEYAIGSADMGQPDEDIQFMTALIETGMILNESRYLNGQTIQTVLGLLNDLDLSGDPYRAEFRELIRKLASVSADSLAR